MTISSTPESTGITEAQAAETFERMLAGDGDSDAGEVLEGEILQPGEDDGADQAAADEPEEPENPEEDPDGDDGEQPEVFTVKIDGQDVQVTLDEALRGYQREADYTRKTQALAADRKAFEDQQKAEVSGERKRTKELLTALEARLAEPEDTEDLEALRMSNPGEYAARIADRMQREEIARAAKAERQRLEAEEAREELATRETTAKEAMGKLLEAIPAWKDPKVAQADMSKITDYAKAIGYADTDLNEILDHRLFIMAKDAAAYRALQAKKPQTQAKVEAVRTARPGTAQTRTSAVTESTRAKQRLAKTGRVDDAASVFMHLIPD
ncbi:hypothetical protein [Caulobacter rhizosphaerae]|uniref:hypothetical protein n=1 Tax=Caulobacter rhizosphaerae TaxID=2010972 RepID=UPI0013D1D053|nr:hypothetical protein [Caulobacter rhizosphaerae]GGL48415.1 hypothetical protein GCM10010983_52210 [Caulobacter rhizosphaerae]